MYIAMNRFRIAPGHEDDFETLWRERSGRHMEATRAGSIGAIDAAATFGRTASIPVR